MTQESGPPPGPGEAELRLRIADLESALDAIRAGGVDAVILGAPEQERLYTLSSSDRPYRVIVEEMGEGAATISESATVLFVNRRLAQLLGQERGGLLGSRVTDLVVPQDAGAFATMLAVPAGSTARGEVSLRCADGTTVPALVSVTGLDIEGVVLRCLVAADLSDRRAAEQLLVDARAALERRAGELETANRELGRRASQFTAAFERSPVGMALVSFDRRVLRANEALARLVGISTGDLVGRTLDDLAVGPSEDLDMFADLVAGRCDTYRCEVALHAADGAPHWVAYTVARVPDEAQGDYAAFHVEDVHDRKGYEVRLQFLADHDPLTGLPNRRCFSEELERFLGLTRRYPLDGAVVLLDLDNFKYVNDTLGHPVGDELLRSVAGAMRSRLRVSDVLARLGGDEFAVLLPGADSVEATAVVEDLLAAVRGEGDASRRVRATASAGIVLLQDLVEPTADELMANADLAMYAAKDHGRDSLVVYDAAGPAAALSQANLMWTGRVRDALEQGLFVLVAQPILELASGQVRGCELLLRMRQGDRLVAPGEFLGIAERHGMSGAIDRYVVRDAIALAGRLGRGSTFRWEVNLSSAALHDAALPDLIGALLLEHGVRPASVVFEITETAAITSMAQAQTFATRVSELGCGFALDDFGAGYGGFYYLKYLPLDYLKIDGEFIRGLTVDRTDQVIVQAVVAAARSLGKQTIAEYVTDRATLELLRSYGVDHAQGYHVGVPVAAEELLASVGAAAGPAGRAQP